MNMGEKVKNLGELYIRPLCNNARIQERGTDQTAGYDLSSAEEVIMFTRGKGVVKTKLAIAIPEGTYVRIAPFFGLAARQFIYVGTCVLDADYRGEVGVVPFNHADNDFCVR